MKESCAKRYFFTTIKLLCILSMLNFSFLFGYPVTAIATESFLTKQQPQPLCTNPSQDLAQNSEPVPNDSNTIVIPISHKNEHNVDNNMEIPSNTNIEGSNRNDVPVAPAEGTDKSTDISENTKDMESEGEAQGQPPTNGMQDTDESGDPQQEEEKSDSDVVDVTAYQQELNGIYKHREDKVAYLTFDDGPTPSITPAILDILAQEGVKATFFVIGSNAERYPELVKRIYQEGHGIGNHSYSHVFKYIYASTENYLDELAKTKQILQSILGEDKEFMLTRFPGGSFGQKLAPFRETVNKAGYLYVDWNCVNGDAETTKKQSAQQLIKKFKDTAKGLSTLVILMHDAPKKDTTVQALPHIIRHLKNENYRFEVLPWSR